MKIRRVPFFPAVSFSAINTLLGRVTYTPT
jgi:hypothetical protein